MYALILIGEQNLLQAAAETIANNPLKSAGWVTGIYALLRIVWASSLKDKLPTFLTAILSKVPGFAPFAPFAPVVVPTISVIIQELVEEMLRQKIPADKVKAITGKLVADLVPEMNKADVGALTKDVNEKCGAAPTSAAGD